MTEPASNVAEGIDNSCRQHMHDAGTAVKEAVHAHCNGDHAAARSLLDEATAQLTKARQFCVYTPPPPAPEQATLL